MRHTSKEFFFIRDPVNIEFNYPFVFKLFLQRGQLLTVVKVSMHFASVIISPDWMSYFLCKYACTTFLTPACGSGGIILNFF